MSLAKPIFKAGQKKKKKKVSETCMHVAMWNGKLPYGSIQKCQHEDFSDSFIGGVRAVTGGENTLRNNKAIHYARVPFKNSNQNFSQPTCWEDQQISPQAMGMAIDQI